MASATLPFTGTFEIDRPHSTVQFAVNHIVSTFRASFDGIEGTLVVDGGEATLVATAEAESVSIVDPPEFREHVVNSDEFFAAQEHPQLTFRSTSIDLRADGGATVTGELTIRGISRSVTAHGSYRSPARDPFGTEKAALELHTTVDRRDWELDWQLPLPDGGDAVGWDVELSAELELVRAA